MSDVRYKFPTLRTSTCNVTHRFLLLNLRPHWIWLRPELAVNRLGIGIPCHLLDRKAVILHDITKLIHVRIDFQTSWGNAKDDSIWGQKTQENE